jgi:hypothetical protein
MYRVVGDMSDFKPLEKLEIYAGYINSFLNITLL